MKKRVMMSLLLIGAFFVLAACGKKNEEEKKEEVKDYDIEQIVELGNYIGLEYKKIDTEATEDEIKSEFDRFLASHPEKITDKPVEKGDTANINYVGKKDGVAFDGGTAEGYNLVIGSGSFIAGFEDGLIGHKPGETVDLNLKFPEEYHAKNLAGAAVVFTVTINYIERAPKELTDEFVTKNSEYKTIANMRTEVKKKIQDEKKIRVRNITHEKLLEQVIKASKIKDIPESLLKSYRDNYLNYYAENAKANKMSLEEYLQKAHRITVEDMNKKADELAEKLSKQKLVIEAIAAKEHLDATGEEYKAELEELYKESGYDKTMDKETFETTLGKENIKNVVLAKKVLKLLEDKGVAK